MLKELFAISNFPSLLQATKQSFGKNIVRLLKIYGLIVLFLLAVVPVMLIADYFVIHALHFKSIRNQSSLTFHHLIQRIGYANTLIYICLLGPILEETVFRLPLSFKKVHIALSVAFAVFLFSGAIPAVKNLSLAIGLIYALLIRLGITGIIYSITIKLIPDNLTVGSGYKKIIIIISICLFGLMHITNYIPVQWGVIWIYPLYVLPQLVMGLALTYIRFKNGFVWGIALHCLINSVSMLIYYQQVQPAKVEQPHSRKI